MTFHSVAGALRWYAQAQQSDGVRSLWPSKEQLESASFGGGSRRDQVDHFLTLWAIWRALCLLTSGDRRLLEMKYIEGLEVHDIMARVDRRQSTVYDRLTRATHLMADRLRAEGLLDIQH